MLPTVDAKQRHGIFAAKVFDAVWQLVSRDKITES